MITNVDYTKTGTGTFSFDNDQATIEEPYGFGLENIQDTYTELPQREGSVSTGWRRNARIFGWTSTVSASTAALYTALRDELFYYLTPDTVEGHTMEFTLLDGTTRSLRYVRCREAPIEIPASEPSIVYNTYSLAFRADYPYFLGTEVTGSQLVTAFSGGTAIPAAVPASMSATSAASSTAPLSLTNAGNAPAYPVFTIIGPGTDFTVSNSTTGEDFTITTTLTAAQSITVDTWFRTVTRDDGSSLRGDFSGSWVTIQGGPAGTSNILTFSAASGSTSATELQTVFNDTYHNI